MEFKTFFENKEGLEQKISETQKEKELSNTELSDSEYKDILREQLPLVKSTPLEALREQNNQIIQEAKEYKSGLTEDEKKKVKEAHPDWPDKIIDTMGSWEEYEIYHKAGLKYTEINGRPCLIRTDIGMDQKDELGRTNKERMEQGLAPLDKNGKPIELHHIRQKADAPLAELTHEEHQGKGNDEILNDKTKKSEIDRGAFRKERNEHWEERAKDNDKE
jgi:FtsZ-binding cell division protein ZapB